MNADKPWQQLCCVCLKVFPVGDPGLWQVGKCRALSTANKAVRGSVEVRPALRRRALAENPGPYLCGACYFDLTES